MKRAIYTHFLLFYLFITFPLFSQEQPPAGEESFSFVGLRLAEVFERFGAPKAVYSARGNELWQDDVVFQYDYGDFFIYRDRVWQVRVPAAVGVTVGDPKQAAVLTLGNRAVDRGDHLFMSISGRDWPLMVRVNINSAGRVASIYVFRPDL
jgi:hypothetical protein